MVLKTSQAFASCARFSETLAVTEKAGKQHLEQTQWYSHLTVLLEFDVLDYLFIDAADFSVSCIIVLQIL